MCGFCSGLLESHDGTENLTQTLSSKSCSLCLMSWTSLYFSITGSQQPNPLLLLCCVTWLAVVRFNLGICNTSLHISKLWARGGHQISNLVTSHWPLNENGNASSFWVHQVKVRNIEAGVSLKSKKHSLAQHHMQTCPVSLITDTDKAFCYELWVVVNKKGLSH